MHVPSGACRVGSCTCAKSVCAGKCTQRAVTTVRLFTAPFWNELVFDCIGIVLRRSASRCGVESEGTGAERRQCESRRRGGVASRARARASRGVGASEAIVRGVECEVKIEQPRSASRVRQWMSVTGLCEEEYERTYPALTYLVYHRQFLTSQGRRIER